MDAKRNQLMKDMAQLRLQVIYIYMDVSNMNTFACPLISFPIIKFLSMAIVRDANPSYKLNLFSIIPDFILRSCQ